MRIPLTLLGLALSALVCLPAAPGQAALGHTAEAASTARTVSSAPRAATARISAQTENQVLLLINRARARHGMRALRLATCPQHQADSWSTHLAAIRQLVHSSLQPLINCPNTWRAGQNIASGFVTARSVVSAWLASPEHRANILNPRYRRMGISGVTSGDGVLYWTQNFIG